MKTLLALTARKVVRALKKLGFVKDRQRDSHLILINPTTNRRTVVPIHGGKTIKKPLLKAIIEDDAGVSIEEFLEEI